MSIRYFSKWLQDEEESFVQWRNTWAWMDLNITEPSQGVIYLYPRPVDASSKSSAANVEPISKPLPENFELYHPLDNELYSDGGSASFLIRRSTLYIFNYSPLLILILGIITNSIQLAICTRLRKRLPAIWFFVAMAITDLICITIGAGSLAIDRLFSTSVDQIHPWACKLRLFSLSTAFDISVWLIPLGLCELWRPAWRLIIYCIITSALLNLQNLVTRGWQVQGDFGKEPIINNCGYSFMDARIFWLHVHPIVSVIINVVGPIFTSMLLIVSLSIQGRCYPGKRADDQYGDHYNIQIYQQAPSQSAHHKRRKRKKKEPKKIKVNLLLTFALLAIVQAILLSPTAVLSAMELFFNTTVHPSMRALVLFGQLLNCAIKLPFICLAAPQLCAAMSNSNMTIYGEKKAKVLVKKRSSFQNNEREQEQTTENELDNSLVTQNRLYESLSKHQHRKHHKKNKQHHNYDEQPMELLLPPNGPPPTVAPMVPLIDAGKQLAHATSTMNRHRQQRPQPPPTLAINDFTRRSNTLTTSHRNNSLTQAAANILQQQQQPPPPPPPPPLPHQQQLYWQDNGSCSSRKIYV